MKLVKDWFRRNFSDPQVVVLTLLLVGGFLAIAFLGGMLIPVLASLVIAYLLDSLVLLLRRYKVPRFPAVMVVYFVFLALFAFVLLWVSPLIFRQAQEAVAAVPSMVQNILDWLRVELTNVQGFVDEERRAQFQQFLVDTQKNIQTELAAASGKFAQTILAFSLSSVQGLIVLFVYLILMPILVFFMLKDKHVILEWFQRFVPKERRLAARVWRDVDRQIGNYVRGKVWEILIVGLVTHLTFSFLGLNYRVLLALLVGFSVIIPYIGATVVTFPVAMVAFAQFGPTSDFLWVVGAYLVIQALDGNVLVPLLFSEVVNLHPIAIIVAILLFGGLWGFWGVFFAIPLATLVQAVLNAWPTFMNRSPKPAEQTEQGNL